MKEFFYKDVNTLFAYVMLDVFTFLIEFDNETLGAIYFCHYYKKNSPTTYYEQWGVVISFTKIYILILSRNNEPCTAHREGTTHHHYLKSIQFHTVLFY